MPPLLADPTTLGGPVEIPVSIVIGDPASGADTEQVGTVHIALRVEGLDDPDMPEGVYRLVPVDPDDVAHQVAHLLERHAAALRAPHQEDPPL